MKLRTLFDGLETVGITGNLETEAVSLVYDSRLTEQGSVFVCIRGFASDGHRFAKAAVDMGAVALVMEERPDFETEAVVVLVQDSRKALATLSAVWFGHPADKLTLIGLTGTKGKTTTAHMVREILEEAGHPTGMIGTLGAFIGQEKIPTHNTTPESYELQSLFARMRDAGCTHVVMEVSSQALKLGRTAGVLFQYGAFLNISPDHVGPGEHADFREYMDCKKRLFLQTEKMVINIDAPYWEEMADCADKEPGHAACELFRVSCEKPAELMAGEIENLWEPGFLGTRFTVKGACQGRIDLNMPGRFNVENALVAIGLAHLMGIGQEACARALRRVTVKGRTQVLKGPSHFTTFIIDYAHNALSMESLLSMLKGYHPGRLVCLFGGGGNKPRQRRYDMGLMAGKYADLTILTTDNPRWENVEDINREIIEGLEVHNGAYMTILDREKAIHYLLDNSDGDDIVALIGKGHEEYQEIGNTKHYFSEEKIVEEYLATK